MPIGLAPTGIVPTGWLVTVSITHTTPLLMSAR